MKNASPHLPGMVGRVATDQRVLAERQWRRPLLAKTAQQQCDIGLFSDDAAQLDLIEMFQDPTNGD